MARRKGRGGLPLHPAGGHEARKTGQNKGSTGHLLSDTMDRVESGE